MKRLGFILLVFFAFLATIAFAGNDIHDFKTGKHHNAVNIYMPSTNEIDVSNIYEAVVWLKNNTLNISSLSSYALKTDVSSEVILHNSTMGAHGLPNPSTNEGKFIKMVDGAFVGAEASAGTLDHLGLSNIGTRTHALLESQIDALTISVNLLSPRIDSIENEMAGGTVGQVWTKTEGGHSWQSPSQGVTDHLLLSNIGVNSHSVIDSILASLTSAIELKANTSDLANYYNKTTTDAKLADKADTATVALKANSADVYTKTEADNKYATITNLGLKANSTDVYTKTETNSAISTAVNAAPTYSLWLNLQMTITRVDDDTFTITDNTTSSIYLKAGLPIKFVISSTTYYAVVNTVTDGGETLTIDICGAAMTDSPTSLYSGTTEKIVVDTFSINGFFADAADTALLANDMFFYYKWGHPKAYLCKTSIRAQVTDSGAANSRINVTLGTADVLTANSNAGLAVSGSWVNSTTDISTTNYGVNFGDTVEVKVDANGTNKDAKNLTVQCIFVKE